MLFDRTEHEPEEYDPEEEFRDPDSDSLTIPDVSRERGESTAESTSVSIPDVSTAETDVPGELLEHFWSLVLVLNAAILAASLGLLFLFFEGRTTRSLALLAGATTLSVFAYRRYRAYEAMEVDDGKPEAAEDGSEVADGTEADDGTGTEDGAESETEAKPDDVTKSDPGDAATDASTNTGGRPDAAPDTETDATTSADGDEGTT
ncbi:DUF7322 domain-containing protein [Halosolutus halophilus]|uniref:DUF7322 domain-containing protein n=1 Tax=Halosolutus halophilus TaxID=1552990 RepID=UPI002234F921|nr:hypothetical protein [Halosolutus halophilus]